MFNGRYGADYLNKALSVVVLALVIVNLFLPYGVVRNILLAIQLVLLGIMFFRMFSKNFEARRRENAEFFRIFGPIIQRFSKRAPGGAYTQHAKRAKKAKKHITFEERRKYKYFYCIQCAQRLRVPRGSGKIRVTCTRCGNKFDMKA